LRTYQNQLRRRRRGIQPGQPIKFPLICPRILFVAVFYLVPLISIIARNKTKHWMSIFIFGAAKQKADKDSRTQLPE